MDNDEYDYIRKTQIPVTALKLIWLKSTPDRVKSIEWMDGGIYNIASKTSRIELIIEGLSSYNREKLCDVLKEIGVFENLEKTMPRTLNDVEIPDEMAEEIERIIKDPDLGFGMMEDFVLEALRRSIVWYGGIR